MVWMSIQLFVVLSIFSSEKPARSYCQDLIKDLKAVVLTGCAYLRFAVVYHTVDERKERDAHKRERNAFLCPVDCEEVDKGRTPCCTE